MVPPMTEVDARRETPHAGRLLPLAGVAAVLAATLALWWRFSDGVYAQVLLNAVIACF